MKAYIIAAAFIKAGVTGETPETMLYIRRVTGEYFRICEGKPVKLTGVKFNEKGIAHVQVKIVEPFKDIEKLKEVTAAKGREYEPPWEEEGKEW